MNPQGAAEYRAGYLAGLRGEPEPKGGRGRAYWLGWHNGMAEREGM